MENKPLDDPVVSRMDQQKDTNAAASPEKVGSSWLIGLLVSLLVLLVLSVKMVMPRSGSVGSIFLFIVLLLLAFGLFVFLLLHDRLLKPAVILLSILALVSIGLRIVYEIKKDDFINAYPNGEEVYLRVVSDVEFTSDFLSGSVYDPRVSLEVNDRIYDEDSDIVRLELGKSYPATVRVSGSGNTDLTGRQNVSGNQEFELMVDSGHTSQVITVNCGLVDADVTLSFTRNVSFWEVLLG